MTPDYIGINFDLSILPSNMPTNETCEVVVTGVLMCACICLVLSLLGLDPPSRTLLHKLTRYHANLPFRGWWGHVSWRWRATLMTSPLQGYQEPKYKLKALKMTRKHSPKTRFSWKGRGHISREGLHVNSSVTLRWEWHMEERPHLIFFHVQLLIHAHNAPAYWPPLSNRQMLVNVDAAVKPPIIFYMQYKKATPDPTLAVKAPYAPSYAPSYPPLCETLSSVYTLQTVLSKTCLVRFIVGFV